MVISYIDRCVGRVIGKITNSQRKFAHGNFNPRESLAQNNTALSPVTRWGISNIDGNRVSHSDDPQKTFGGNFGRLFITRDPGYTINCLEFGVDYHPP